MGFYNDKIAEFSKLVRNDEEDYAFAQSKTIRQKEKFIEDLVQEIKYLNKMRTTGEFSTAEAQGQMTLTKMQLDFIKSLKPVEFMQFMIYVENYELQKNCVEVSKNVENSREVLSNYRNKKGFLGKSSAIFGVNKKIVEKKSNLLENEKIRNNYYNSEYGEWNSLSPENQAKYIAGRTIFDNLSDFDKNGHENNVKKLIEKNAEMKQNIENQREI